VHYSRRPYAHAHPAMALALRLPLLTGEAWRVGAPREARLDGPRGPAGDIIEDETLLIQRVGEELSRCEVP
jgi:hypothetical protein